MAIAQVNLGRAADAVHAADRAVELDGEEKWGQIREYATSARDG